MRGFGAGSRAVAEAAERRLRPSRRHHGRVPARGRLGRSARAASAPDTHRDKSVAMMVFEYASKSLVTPTTRYGVGDISRIRPVCGHDELIR